IVSLELVNEAIKQATRKTEQAWRITEVKWNSPIVISEHNKELHTSLMVLEDNKIRFEQYSSSVHAHGIVSFMQGRPSERLDIERIKQQFNEKIYHHEECYRELEEYGHEYKAIRELQLGNGKALARINVPHNSGHFDEFLMHPSLIESAIQTIKLLMKNEQLSLKSLAEITVLSGRSNADYCYIDAYNAYICDADGNVNIKIVGLSFDEPTVKKTESNSGDTIEHFLAESLASALYVNASEVNPDKQFVDMGLDSIIGVEWLQAINKKYQTRIHASKIYDYPTIRDFSAFLASQLEKAYA
ncbi:MAG: hypothetical protein EPO11_09500, partial [Gammaproteobacteria bacterium]